MVRRVTKIRINYNPYLKETVILINNKTLGKGKLWEKTQKQSFDKWINYLPKFLQELNAYKISIQFCGLESDWMLIEKIINEAELNNVSIKYKKGIYYKDFVESVASEFSDLRRYLIIDDPDNNELIEAYNKVSHPFFSIDVVSTMSSGKSTLINALLAKKLLPSQNEACTASVIEVLDTDAKNYTAKVYDSEGSIIKKYQKNLDEYKDIDASVIAELNKNQDINKISIEGDIPFLDSRGTALMLVDTPGTNNSQDSKHQDITFKEICNNDRSIILYVLNATQLGTNDDAKLLKYVSDQIKEKGNEIEDRLLFVINKMDSFDPEEEDIEKCVNAAKRYLVKNGIHNPRMFVCSAITALLVQTDLKGIDVPNLSRTERKALPIEVRSSIPIIDKILDYEEMHFEKYATVSNTTKREVEETLEKAIKENDYQKQAFIHSGVYSLEKYISLYIKAQTAKDLMEFLKDTLDKSIL